MDSGVPRTRPPPSFDGGGPRSTCSGLARPQSTRMSTCQPSIRPAGCDSRVGALARLSEMHACGRRTGAQTTIPQRNFDPRLLTQTDDVHSFTPMNFTKNAFPCLAPVKSTGGVALAERNGSTPPTTSTDGLRASCCLKLQPSPSTTALCASQLCWLSALSPRVVQVTMRSARWEPP
eukprot:COSAG04_NODE_1202_length_7763_cov_21.569285_6_plen_177_part_00